MTVGPGTASLQGAVFALEYYATTASLHDNMPPARTWYYQTDNNGQIYSTGEAYLVPELIESDGSVLWSDELYLSLIHIYISATDRDIIASVAGVTGMDAAAVEAVVNHYQGGIYDENGNLVTAQRDELTGAMAGRCV